MSPQMKLLLSFGKVSKEQERGASREISLTVSLHVSQESLLAMRWAPCARDSDVAEDFGKVESLVGQAALLAFYSLLATHSSLLLSQRLCYRSAHLRHRFAEHPR